MRDGFGFGCGICGVDACGNDSHELAVEYIGVVKCFEGPDGVDHAKTDALADGVAQLAEAPASREEAGEGFLAMTNRAWIVR